jgi:hypothetical protein
MRRTKSVSTKVTEDEYAKFVQMAEGQTVSEWVGSRSQRPSDGERSVSDSGIKSSPALNRLLSRKRRCRHYGHSGPGFSMATLRRIVRSRVELLRRK